MKFLLLIAFVVFTLQTSTPSFTVFLKKQEASAKREVPHLRVTCFRKCSGKTVFPSISTSSPQERALLLKAGVSIQCGKTADKCSCDSLMESIKKDKRIQEFKELQTAVKKIEEKIITCTPATNDSTYQVIKVERIKANIPDAPRIDEDRPRESKPTKSEKPARSSERRRGSRRERPARSSGRRERKRGSRTERSSRRERRQRPTRSSERRRGSRTERAERPTRSSGRRERSSRRLIKKPTRSETPKRRGGRRESRRRGGRTETSRQAPKTRSETPKESDPVAEIEKLLDGLSKEISEQEKRLN